MARGLTHNNACHQLKTFYILQLLLGLVVK